MLLTSVSDILCKTLSMTAVHFSTSVGGQSHPVLPSTTVSRGPPVLAANTGTPANMASRGTIPKCSFEGVYMSSLADLSSISFKVLGTERRKSTSTSVGTLRAVTMVFVVAVLRPSDSARATSSSWQTTFSVTRLS